MRLAILVLFGTVALLAGAWWLWEKPPVFSDVTSLVFTGEQWETKPLKLEITEPKDIAAFVGTLQLEKKEACKCGHWLTVVFKGARTEIKVSICDHCFDVVEGTKVRRYEMPKAFYAEFKKRIPEPRRTELHL